MADLLELAQRHMQSNGMSAQDAVKALEVFATGTGRDVSWHDAAPYLPKPLVERIDRAAVGWMMAHQQAQGASPNA